MPSVYLGSETLDGVQALLQVTALVARIMMVWCCVLGAAGLRGRPAVVNTGNARYADRNARSRSVSS